MMLQPHSKPQAVLTLIQNHAEYFLGLGFTASLHVPFPLAYIVLVAQGLSPIGYWFKFGKCFQVHLTRSFFW